MVTGLELRLALAAAIAAGAMVMYLIALMMAARIYGRYRRLRRANFVDSWVDYLASDKPPLEARILALHPEEVHHLIQGWNLAAEREGSGPGRERLRSIAYKSGLTHAAVAFAFRGKTRDHRLSGIRALGLLGRSEVLERLVGIISDSDHLIGLAAFEAVVAIDPAPIRDRLSDIICGRPEWPEHALASCIQEMDELSRAALIVQSASADATCVNRVVSALEKIHHAGATRLLKGQIAVADSATEIASMLYAVQDTGHIRLVETAVRKHVSAAP